MATVEEALSIALDLHTGGHTAEAAELYRRILDAVPDHPDALYLCGMLHAQAGAYAEAADLLARAIQARPDAPDAHLHRGNALRLLGRVTDAEPALRRAAVLRPDHLAAWDALAALAGGSAAAGHAVRLDPRPAHRWDTFGQRLAEEGRYAALAAMLLNLENALGGLGIFWKAPYYIVLNIANRRHAAGDRAGVAALLAGLEPFEDRFPARTRVWLEFLKGSVAAATGDWAQAGSRFAAIETALPMVRHFALNEPFEERVAIDPEAWAAYRAGLRDHGPVPDGTGPVLVCAADGVYAAKFAPLFLASADTFAHPGLRIHLHVVDPGEGTMERLARLGAGLTNARLALTWETAPANLSTVGRMTYFTCVRFLRLPDLIARYRAPMVIGDIDAVWLADPGAFADAVTPAQPLALVRNPATLAFLYDAVGGSLAALLPVAPALRFAGDVARFLFRWLERGELNYFLDQIALVQATERHEGEGGLTGIRGFEVADGVFRLDGGAVYQFVAGKRDPRFEERAAALLAAGATPERLRAFVAEDQARARG
jgi:tetratricopeptide (TPR) repeat protein